MSPLEILSEVDTRVKLETRPPVCLAKDDPILILNIQTTKRLLLPSLTSSDPPNKEKLRPKSLPSTQQFNSWVDWKTHETPSG